MTTIPTHALERMAHAQFLRTELLGNVRAVDIRNVSTTSATSDLAFKVADTDGDKSLSINEFTALGKKGSSDANAQALFAAIDGDKDGKLNAHEVRASGLLSPGNVKALLGVDDVGAWAVSQADGNGDGRLSYEEYVESRGAGPVKASFTAPNGEKVEIMGSRLDVIRSVFDSMDADGDGHLSASEFNANLAPQEGSAPYRPSTGAEGMSQTLVSQNDADGDGALSTAELASAIDAPTYAAESEDDVDNLVTIADSNKDGKVSGEEFATLAARSRTPYAFEAWQGEADGAARLMLNRLLKSTFAQLQDDFAAPPRADAKA